MSAPGSLAADWPVAKRTLGSSVVPWAVLVLVCCSCSRENKPAPPDQPRVAPVVSTAPVAVPNPTTATDLASVPVSQRFATRRFDALGTTVQVQLPATATMANQLRIVREVFEVVQLRLSDSVKGSQIARINAAAGVKPVAVDADIRWLLSQALEVSHKTGRAWDVTAAALESVWRFDDPALTLPSASTLAAAVGSVNAAKLHIDEAAGTVKLLSKGMRLSLVRVARGYAMQLAGEKLRMLGVRSFTLSAGDQTLVAGGRRGAPWLVAVDDPGATSGTVALAQLKLFNAAVASRSTSDRHFERDGVSYHDVVDPRTGKPSRAAIRATVVMDEPILASAIAHALVVLGPDKGMRVLRSLKDVEAVIIDNEGRLHTTAGLATKLTIAPAGPP